ncbi:MAG TPA: DUF4388 domain-containing protein [Pyrinomonadaceae bacterium]|nr:DUF4388 domain-containing protein [Pyrinomonadaceae bacterium]
MALTGHLSDLSLSELIEFFCNQRKTGELKVLYPQGAGSFYLHSGSVVDARIGVLRGIDAVYYSLTLPSAKFEFSGTAEAPERTINQPWTQVVLEGLRRLDEGVVPTPAFPDNYSYSDSETLNQNQETNAVADFEPIRVPGFLSFIGKESLTKRKSFVAGGVVVAVLLSVAAIGVPAGWYGRPPAPPVVAQPAPKEEVVATTATEPTEVAPVESEESVDNSAALAAKRQRDKEKASAREEKLAAQNQANPVAPTVPSATSATVANAKPQPEKPGPKRITVTVTYDESGRVTQASGGDASAVRIARQKRFPAGKAGSATVTIPIN